jgi:hypothetical protein
MANDELIALLKKLQGQGAVGSLNPGVLTQIPSLVAAAAEATVAKDSAPSGKSTAAAALNTVAGSTLRAAGGGLTLLPVVSGLLRLFGVGQKKEELPALEKFELPAPIRAEAGLSQSGDTFLIDRGVGDRIRQLPSPAATISNNTAPVNSETRSAGAAITVNVQAMDSQSFLDRREDIARAVREAMLQSHSLNDVVSEL